MNDKADIINRISLKALAAILLLLLLAGCSHNQNWVKVEHPGNLELINMGYDDHEGNTVRVTKAHNKVFISYLETKGPSLISVYLLEHIEVKKGETVLDMGTGSGIQAIFAAENASHVLAVDIDETAVRNAVLNAKLHGVEDKIAVRKSDLFNNVRPDEKFDVIISNIPFPWDEKTQHYWKLQERFFSDVKKHLNHGGRIYFLSGLLDNLPRTRELVEQNNLKIARMNMAFNEDKWYTPELVIYQFEHKPESTGNNK